MKQFSISSLIIAAAFAFSASAIVHADVITYKGACMVYLPAKGKPGLKTLANMDVSLSKSAQVLYTSKGYSFEVEQVDMTFVDDNNRVEHGLVLRIMKRGELISLAESEIGTSKNSGAILMNRGLPTISCSHGE